MPRRAIFWSYDPERPSFRIRLAPVIAELAARGWDCRIERFPRGRHLRRIAERRRDLESAELLVIAKLNLAPGERQLLRRWAPAVAFDFDDAIYLRKPRRLGQLPGRSLLRRFKFAESCRSADLVLAGNRELARHASPFSRRLEIAPTPITMERYPQGPAERRPQTLVWIGLGENLLYLDLLRPALARAAREFPEMVLRVVSSDAPRWDEVPIERVPWSADGEAMALATAGIGLMPLSDDAWTRGKCAFKLLQYMAAGLPCLASPVGTNFEVVVPDKTGYLCRDDDQWFFGLHRLLSEPDYAAALGWTGRRRAEAHYATARIAPRVADRLEEIATEGARR
ncbi:MAG: glycosyltransferase [Acidobacteriota bacterium]